MRRALLALLALVIAGAIVFYLLTMPAPVLPSAVPEHQPDIANGEYMFIAGGCAECHAAPVKACDDLKIEEKEVLPGAAA